MRKRGVWAAFAACAGLVVAAIAWVSREALEREASQQTAEQSRIAAETLLRRQESLRVALWRLDSALATVLAQEAGQPFYFGDRERFGNVAEFRNEVVRARFLVRPERSPWTHVTTRAPVSEADAAVVALLLGVGERAIRTHVQRFEPAVNDAQVRIQAAAPDWNSTANASANGGDRAQRMRALQNLDRQSAQQELVVPDEVEADSRVGPLIPLWVGSDALRLLAFVRRTGSYDEAGEVLQCFALDWARLRAQLLAEIADILPGADLRPAPEGSVADESADLFLATAPIALVEPALPCGTSRLVETSGVTATRVGLAVAWGAVFAALAAAALTLRSSLADSERRARFASSVTHELRTPLTTFRLYSEMLADGMVTDPAQRQVYLDTLKSESARLATLVENVLAYARVEEGRAPRQRERIAVAALLDRLVPPLRRRAEDAKMDLVVDAGDAADATLDVHADALGQVLSNLVDNACKYAASAEDRRIELTVARRGDAVAFRVRDHGPGIAPENVAAAFTPFERGNRPPGDGVPGIGLGLALSRGLARDQGGDLAVEPCDGGACLVLTLGTRAPGA